MLLLLAGILTIPLGLDLYMPVPEDNPITPAKIEQGRRLFHDRRLSRDQNLHENLTHAAHFHNNPNGRFR